MSMDKQKVVITGTVGVMTPATVEKITEMIQEEVPGTEVEFLYDLPVSDEEIIKGAKGASVIINQFQPMSENIYKALLPELRGFIANGIGTNAANVPIATKMGIVVANVPDYCQDEVASHAAALILACQRQLPNLMRWTKEGKWGGGFKAFEEITRFAGSTVGIFGFGRIPRKLAKMLSGFDLRIIAHDPYLSDEIIRSGGAEPVSFEQLIKESDFLTLHAPLVSSTEGVISREVFKQMKPSAVLINTARGGLVDPQALYDALVNKEIRFAALDAFISEPPVGIEKEIIDLPNVIVTPHVGYYSRTAMDDLLEKVAQETGRILRGEKPRNFINPDVAPKITWFKK